MALSIREAIVTRVMQAGGRLKVRSALNPILWLCGIITVPALIAFSLMKQPPNWLVILAFAPVITAINGSSSSCSSTAISYNLNLSDKEIRTKYATTELEE